MHNKRFSHCGHIPAEADQALSKAYESISSSRNLIPDTGKAANLATDLVDLYRQRPRSAIQLIKLYAQIQLASAR
jgi:hypothetical protein